MTRAELESLVSPPRLNRYLVAGLADQQIVDLYFAASKLSVLVFHYLCFFEVVFRNKIDLLYSSQFQNRHQECSWLIYLISPNGPFAGPKCEKVREIIEKTLQDFQIQQSPLSHSALLCNLSFGFWCGLFNRVEYRALGQNLLNIFTERPRNSDNRSQVFDKLHSLNQLRNRIAHNEGICFSAQGFDFRVLELRVAYLNQFLTWLNIDLSTRNFFKNEINQQTQLMKGILG